MNVYRRVKACRLCGGNSLIPVFSLGEQYLTGFPRESPEFKDPKPPKAPLDVVVCDDCQLSQLQHSVTPDVIYKDYYYRSGTSNTMREALAQVVAQATARVQLVKGDAVADIGSNDGTLLLNYAPWLERVGFDPSNIGKDATPEISTIPDYFSFFAWETLFGKRKAKVVTSCAMFYDVEDPRRFVHDVRRVLHQDGIWINQLNYLPLVLKNNAYDFISHEHVTMWGLWNLKRALEQEGLELFDAELLPLNGGTVRAYIQHQRGFMRAFPITGRLEGLLEQEEVLQRKQWLTFKLRVAMETARLQETVDHQVRFLGKRVAVRGASTRGNVIIQHAELDRWIAWAADRDPKKWGRMIGGSNIRIASEDGVKERIADTFVVLIYSYVEELKQRDAAWREKGGRYIMPLPEVRIV